MWCWTYVVVLGLAALSERPEDQHAGRGVHRHASRRGKVGAQSLQVSSLMALVNIKGRNHTEGSVDPEVVDDDNNTEPPTSDNANQTNVDAEGRQMASEASNAMNETNAEERQSVASNSKKEISSEERQTALAVSNDGQNHNSHAASATDGPTRSQRKDSAEHTLKRTGEDKVNENLSETDEDKVLALVKGIDPWKAALIHKFKESNNGYCLAVKEDSLKYGCAWRPRDRSNMTQKDKNVPACSCGSWLWIESCWHPDADAVMSHIQAKNDAKAFEFAKAYIAGMCYTPIWTWVVLGLLILFLCCCGGWAVKTKGEDLRLVGSTLDKARNLGS